MNEFAFFVFLGDAGPELQTDDMLSTSHLNETTRGQKVRWEPLMKGSNNARRQDRPNLFYPVFVQPETRAIHSVGEAIPLNVHRSTVVPPGKELVAVWPLSPGGGEKRWQCSPDTLRDLHDKGMVQCSTYDAANDRWTLLYLNRGQRERIQVGEIRVSGKDENGVLQLEQMVAPKRMPMTVWNRPSHNAGFYGSGVISSLLLGKKFPFPKSLYAVEDCLRTVLSSKREALVLDFFAGSGTTTHAVARLNRQDGGRRRSIVVSNNEVSPEEAKTLRKQGHAPGDPEWEALGIFDYITRPRIKAAITGRTPKDEPVKGDYKFTDEFPMADGFEENVEFYTLTYEDPDRVRAGAAFAAVAPLLWLKAGAQGPRIDHETDTWALPDGSRYGVLFSPDYWPEFTAAINASETVSYAFVVTDSDAVFQQVAADLPPHVEAVRLYEDYLTSFAINTGVSS